VGVQRRLGLALGIRLVPTEGRRVVKYRILTQALFGAVSPLRIVRQSRSAMKLLLAGAPPCSAATAATSAPRQAPSRPAAGSAPATSRPLANGATSPSSTAAPTWCASRVHDHNVDVRASQPRVVFTARQPAMIAPKLCKHTPSPTCSIQQHTNYRVVSMASVRCVGQVLAGGENVYCTEVEATLAAHPAVGAPADAMLPITFV